jgi:ribosome-associated toxin RatA of RatAB toxin-antitoxin module
MYSLADDIDLYWEFLPWCENSEVLERTATEVVARIDVSFKGLNTSFTTRNHLVSGQEISMRLVEGPFQELAGEWRFAALDDSVCRVSLDVQFSLVGHLADRVIAPVFKQICTSLIQSFADRAKTLYGNRNFA